MKLPNMALIFVIIIVPILLIFSLYVGYQIKTVSKQTTYDTRLVSATRDAITALEMNTFGDSTKDNATSTRRNVKASVNTFLNSFASNFGITGYDNNDVLSYVPALLVTMYDGYYIYAPTTDAQEIENQEDNDFYANYVLKPYIYYSARYKSGTEGNKDYYDVVINYSLDNYITITGTVGKEYISKSGYLIDTSRLILEGDNTVKGIYIDDEKKKSVTLEAEKLYEKISIPLEDYNLDGEINYTGDWIVDGTSVAAVVQGTKEPTVVTLNCRYCYMNNQKYYYFDENGTIACSDKNINDMILRKDYEGKWFTCNTTGKFIAVNADSLGLNTDLLNDDSAIKFYQEAYNFSCEIDKLFPDGITGNTLIKPNGVKVIELTDASDPYYIFNDDETDVLDATEDAEVFTQHKLNVMQASITENLNVAMSNYSNGEVSNFYMPEMSETEWEKILTNISMVSFVQGMPIGFKTYNNYAIVTSTNNEMYVGENSIYYVLETEETTDKYHHKANCDELAGKTTITGYASTDFDEYTICYTTEYSTKNKGTETHEHYISYYRHHSLDCYECIVNNKTGNDSEAVQSAKIHATARIKYNQYKVTQYINNKTQ